MKCLVFDSSSVISISTNNLLEILFKLKKHFNGEFFISESVKKELIDNPLMGKKFELQAIMLADYVSKGEFKFFQNIGVESKADVLVETANSIFSINGEYLKIVDKAEIEGLVLAVSLKAEAYVVDERTLRLLIEDYRHLTGLFERKFNAEVEVNKSNLKRFNEMIYGVKIIRSAELMTIAFELGLFDNLSDVKTRDFDKKLLDGILWGLRLRGCSISTKEINEILKLEKFNKH